MISRRIRVSDTPGQDVRIAGKLDVLRHSDKTFTLVLESGARVPGVVASDGVDLASLAALWGGPAVVSGVGEFSPSGLLLRVDTERIERADERDLAQWGTLPRPMFGPLNERSLRRQQGPRSGVSAIFGQLRGEDSDEEIIEALDRLS